MLSEWAIFTAFLTSLDTVLYQLQFFVDLVALPFGLCVTPRSVSHHFPVALRVGLPRASNGLRGDLPTLLELSVSSLSSVTSVVTSVVTAPYSVVLYFP